MSKHSLSQQDREESMNRRGVLKPRIYPFLFPHSHQILVNSKESLLSWIVFVFLWVGMD